MEENIRKTQFQNLCELLKKSREKQTSPFHTLRATKLRSALIGKLFRRAYQKDSVVAWRNSFVPTEMLFALDIVPFPPESVISMFANSHLTDDILTIAEDNNYSRDTCSFLRGTIGAAIDNYMPMPDFFIVTSLYCHGSAQTFYSLSKRYNKEFYYIDIPSHYSRVYVVDYVARQIEDITKKMAQKIKREFDLNKLKEAIDYSNQARNYYLKVNELRKNKPTPMLGIEAIDYAIMLAHTFGCKEMVEICKTLYNELKQRVDNGKGSLDEERHRILWRHLRPYYTIEPLEYLEIRHKAAIVFEEVNYVYWPEMDPEQPFRSLAKKLLSNPATDFSNKWLNYTISLVEQYEVGGLVEFAHWGCRYLTANTQIVKETFQAKNIPILVIEGDCIDRRDYSDGQIKTRIDAFIEILNRKKGY
ncbi:MAG: 2-hydroxyacyl-CoA dehydratase family protein [Candidatus Omnitrophota bacterium]